MDYSQQTTAFFTKYLNLDIGAREHISVLFTDIALPKWFRDGLGGVTDTTWKIIDARKLDSQRALLETLWDPQRRYISVHDYTVSTFFGNEQSAVKFAEISTGIDYTSFEFPRYDVEESQVETLLKRYVSGDPNTQLGDVDCFFHFLDDDPAYVIDFHTGPGYEHVLTVRGPEPWMELAGPLCEGNMRFAPGAEIFYHGNAVNGELYCAEGINLLPLRSGQLEKALCQHALQLGRLVMSDPLVLAISLSRITAIDSVKGHSAKLFRQICDEDEAFLHLVEVGIGMNPSAGPLIHNWAATSNEAVPGVHIGVGADPANTSRFQTNVHLDFVCPSTLIQVNKQQFYDGQCFTKPIR
ncbi:M29 family metallopeptidase [Porticoccus sp.]